MGLFDLPKLSIGKVLPRGRDVQRMISTKRIREPVNAKIKTAVRKRAGNKCEARGCNHSKYLEFHHKNMKNDDNKVANIILLCPNHHREYHDKYKVTSKKDVLGYAIPGSTKVISKTKAIADRKAKKNLNILGMPISTGKKVTRKKKKDQSILEISSGGFYH